MKILFDYQIFSGQVYGGISRYFVELAKNIPRVAYDGTNVSIVAPFYKNHHLVEAKETIKPKGIYIPDMARSGRLVNSLNNIISNVSLNFNSFDILHETYYSDTRVGNQKIKRVITVYDMIHELFPQVFSINDKTAYRKKAAIRRADHVICISQSTKNDLIKILDTNPEKISVIPLGVGLPVTPNRGSLKLSRPYILYVGQRGGYKNFISLVRAYASSPRLCRDFDILCFGGGEFTSAEINLFAKLKLPKDKVHQIVGGDNLLAYCYSNAAAFIYPSVYEGFGIPPLEAMTYGCPTACSNTSSMPEVVGDAAVMFDPTSVLSVRDSLDEVLYSSSIRTNLIKNGFNNVKRFSWQSCAMKTFLRYRWLIQ